MVFDYRKLQQYVIFDRQRNISKVLIYFDYVFYAYLKSIRDSFCGILLFFVQSNSHIKKILKEKLKTCMQPHKKDDIPGCVLGYCFIAHSNSYFRKCLS